MSYFGSLTESCFKITPDGKNIFYPWGITGKGYVIPNQERVIELRRLIKRFAIFNILFISLLVFLTRTFGIFVAGMFLGLYLFIYFVTIQTITRKLEIAEEKLTLSEVRNQQTKEFTYVDLIFMTLASLGFVVGGILMIQKNETGKGGLVILFFGSCFFVFSRMLIKKIQGK